MSLKSERDGQAVLIIIEAIALTVFFSSFPLERFFNFSALSNSENLFLAGAVKRTVGIAVAVYLTFKYGFYNQYKKSAPIFAYLGVIPALIVVINNFPFIGVIKTNQPPLPILTVILYTYNCLSVAFLEEIFFRGIIFPLLIICFKDKKANLFYSVLISSALFSAIHLINLFSGQNIGATLLQVGYTFLIGAMLCICFNLTENIFVPITLHFIFDFGGNGLFTCEQWDIITVILTAVIGVISCAFYVYKCLKGNTDKLKRNFEIK